MERKCSQPLDCDPMAAGLTMNCKVQKGKKENFNTSRLLSKGKISGVLMPGGDGTCMSFTVKNTPYKKKGPEGGSSSHPQIPSLGC